MPDTPSSAAVEARDPAKRLEELADEGGVTFTPAELRYLALAFERETEALEAYRKERDWLEEKLRALQADPALGFSKAELKALDYATEWVGDVEPDTPISMARAKLQRSLEARK